MLCLGVETSCDESALALVHDGELAVELVRSQADAHALFGGVVPELASREHYRAMGPLYDALLRAAEGKGLRLGENCRIDCIAAARGPGLLGSLLVGVSFAKALALALGVPVLGVNHLHAHLLASGLEHQPPFLAAGPDHGPALGLLASGGHTHLYRINGPDDFILMGRSIDDAAGEAFDKFGKAMGFDYPAGQRIDVLAGRGRVDRKMFPCPYLENDNLDFSFSGLKTAAVSYLAAHGDLLGGCVKEISSLPAGELAGLPMGEAELRLADVCASFNFAVARTLKVKSGRALERCRADGAPAKALVLAGGVAANSAVRTAMRELADEWNLPFMAPSFQLCTDNAAMIAYSGWLLHRKGLRHGLDFSVIPRGRNVPRDYTVG